MTFITRRWLDEKTSVCDEVEADSWASAQVIAAARKPPETVIGLLQTLGRRRPARDS